MAVKGQSVEMEMPAAVGRPDPQRVAGFNFRRLGKTILLTNDWGNHSFIGLKEFRRYLRGGLKQGEPLFEELCAKGFIRDCLDFRGLARQFQKLNVSPKCGPSLHIFVVTLRCNHKCVYCQSSAARVSGKDGDMSLETAKAAVDFAFCTPSPMLVIEFQGGEPLLNWPVVEFIVRYARRKNEIEKKQLLVSLVSNLSLMDDEKFGFLLANEVSLCGSLDGPEILQKRNRLYPGGDSYAGTVHWLGKIQSKYRESLKTRERIFKPNAIMTATRFSLPFWKEIVDEYAALGLEKVFLRPVSPIGFARKVWDRIGYEPGDFVRFYFNALDYIVDLNLRGHLLIETFTFMLLSKILRQKDTGFLDLTSPCGAALGQLAYNYDGGIYACDEARMLARNGEVLFKLGNVFDSSFDSVVTSRGAQTCAVASSLEGQPLCSRCAYKPFCGVCPVHSYQTQNSIWGLMPDSSRCAMYKAIFDGIFERIRQSRLTEVFESWRERCDSEEGG